MWYRAYWPAMAMLMAGVCGVFAFTGVAPEVSGLARVLCHVLVGFATLALGYELGRSGRP